MSESESANDAEKAREPSETGDAPPQIPDQHNAAPDPTSASHTPAKESRLTEEIQTQSTEPSQALKKDPTEAPSLNMLHNVATPGTSTVSMTPTPKVIVSSAPVRSATPLVLGERVASTSVTAAGASGQTSASHPGGLGVMSNQVRPPAVTQAPLRAAIVALPRASTSPQNVTVPRSAQSTSLQLPANFQIPQGMVLIRSDTGQLMLVSQQALAQAQAQGLVPKSSNVTTTVRPQTSQAAATSIIRVSLPSSSSAVATLVKPMSSAGKAALKPSLTMTTAIIKPTTTGSTIITPPSVLGTGLKPSSITGLAINKTTPAQKPPISTITGTINQRTVTGTSVQSASGVKSVGKVTVSSSVTQSIRPVGSGPRNISPNIPIKSSSSSKASTPGTVTAETLENVKKCKNFLITLMKLASSGTRLPDMAQNVRALVKGLLDGQLEAEEFTEKLYMELKSSPQPYLVPFLKRSLPAVRQLTPNSQLFIQQCEQPKASSPAPVSSSAQKLSLSSSTTVSQSLRGSVPSKPPQMVIQHTKGVFVEQHMTSSPRVGLPVQKLAQPKQPVIQANTQAAGGNVAFRRQHALHASKIPSGPTQATQTYNFKDNTSGSFREDDDINDVASMAGVNVNEENARILASSSELVGRVVHSCRDEPFLHTAALQKRVLHIGNPLSIAEVNPDVLGLLSHATQERLRDLLEKLTVIARHHNISYRDDWRNIRTSDTRSQLKFLEQLEKVAKQKREEEERETLLRIAKSRMSSEDPEQLRLRQRAKEMQQLELAQMEHRDANLAALAALGPRKRKPLETSGSGNNQVLGLRVHRSAQRLPTRVTFRDLIFCMEQDRALRHSRTLYNAFSR